MAIGSILWQLIPFDTEQLIPIAIEACFGRVYHPGMTSDHLGMTSDQNQSMTHRQAAKQPVVQLTHLRLMTGII